MVFSGNYGLKLPQILRSSPHAHQKQPKCFSGTVSSAEYYFGQQYTCVCIAVSTRAQDLKLKAACVLIHRDTWGSTQGRTAYSENSIQEKSGYLLPPGQRRVVWSSSYCRGKLFSLFWSQEEQASLPLQGLASVHPVS